MMEAVCISETSVNFYETTQRNISKAVIFILAAVETWNLTGLKALTTPEQIRKNRFEYEDGCLLGCSAV
jgi:hypothetical protein